MAGTIAADTLTHSTAGSLGTQFVVNGSAKAWGNISGSGTATLDNSLNVASLTDHGTADYSINFLTSFANNEICTTALAMNMGSGDRLYPSLNAFGTSSAARVATFDEDGNSVDSGEVNIVVHGDI